MAKGYLAKHYSITETGVSFSIGDEAIQKVYDDCEALTKENIKQFGDRRVMVEGAKYHGVWLETQPMGGEMYATRDMDVALNNQLMPALYQEHDLDSLCLRLQEVAENFMTTMFYEQDKGNLYIRRALRYMTDHYSEHLTLALVAEYVQLSPSYFSTLFSQVVGLSFRDQLCRIRIEESKRLLLSTDYSLANIAVAVGFPDQSYFCKAFKRIVGLTPGKFRG